MIVVDVNVLVYAFRPSAPGHGAYASWLGRAVEGIEMIALTDTVLTGFVRVVTNRRIQANPAPAPAALDFVHQLRSLPRTQLLSSSETVWRELDRIAAEDRRLAGSLVPDAYLAATAIAHGAQLATADRGFARFGGLRWFDPAA